MGFALEYLGLPSNFVCIRQKSQWCCWFPLLNSKQLNVLQFYSLLFVALAIEHRYILKQFLCLNTVLIQNEKKTYFKGDFGNHQRIER